MKARDSIVQKLKIQSFNNIRDDVLLVSLMEKDNIMLNNDTAVEEEKLVLKHNEFLIHMPDIPSSALLYSCKYLLTITEKMKNYINNNKDIDNLYDDFEYVVWVLNENFYKYKEINKCKIPEGIYSEYNGKKYSLYESISAYEKCLKEIIKKYPDSNSIMEQHERMGILNHIILNCIIEKGP